MSRPDTAGRRERDRHLFNRIAASYVRKDLLPASRLARLHRLQQTLRKVDIPPGADILEVGCGAGFAGRYLRGRYQHYVGLDDSRELIALARQHNSGPGAAFEAVSLERFRSERAFDLIFMIGVLHHIEDKRQAMSRAAALLKPGGWLVVNEPQPANPLARFARWLRKRYSSAYSDEQDQLSARQLEQILQQAGLTECEIVPQGCFSTPLAEVAMPAVPGLEPLARLACRLDRVLEDRFPRPLLFLSWNLIAAGRRPRGSVGDLVGF